jgi:importin subunit alpha-6/7
VSVIFTRMEDRLANRRNQFKKTSGQAEDVRRAREDESVQIRKKERDEQLARRRKFEDFEEPEDFIPVRKTYPNLEVFLEQIKTGTPEVKLSATQAVRKQLSIEHSPPIQPVIDLGFVPYLSELLKAEQFPEIQFEAAWALTNIASGTPAQTKVVVDQGCLGLFVALLDSPNVDVREQSVWALGNISGDSARLRDECLMFDLVPKLLHLARHFEKMSFLRNVTWCMGNLCRGKPPVDLNKVRALLPALVTLISHQDNEVVQDSAWALAYLSDGDEDRIRAVVESGSCMRLVELLGSQYSNIQTPAIRAIGNILTGSEHPTSICIQCGVLPALFQLMKHAKKSIRKEACWAISNITAGTAQQVQAVINSGIFPRLVETLQTGEFEVKKEAAWAVSNSTSSGTPEQLEYMVSCGIIPPICSLLKLKDTRLVMVLLEALVHLLAAGERIYESRPELLKNPFLDLIEECDGLTIIEELQEDENEDIYNRAQQILSHFPTDDDQLPQQQAFNIPSQGFQGGFSF